MIKAFYCKLRRAFLDSVAVGCSTQYRNDTKNQFSSLGDVAVGENVRTFGLIDNVNKLLTADAVRLLSTPQNPQQVTTSGVASVSSTLTGTSIARDSARKSDLYNIYLALEAYKLKQQQYPQKSGCVDGMLELTPYYSTTVPKDPNGTQDFKVAQCSSGYYYEYVSEKEYILWAKMENHNLGNIDDTPDVWAQKLASRISLAYGGQGGNYFMLYNDSQEVQSYSAPQPASNSRLRQFPIIISTGNS